MDTDADSTLLWERRYAELSQWKRLHGNCNVPKAEGKLGRWVVRQRELHKKAKLDLHRKAQLDRLGFVWNTNEAAWEHRYAHLLHYYRLNGHCCVPISDPNLGMWVAKMRANRRKDKLPLHRVRKLDAIGFIWNTAEADWMDKFNKLLHFRATEGHACVPFNEGELGWWVNTQRQSKRKGKLSAHRERLLNEAGFIWNPQQFLAERRRRAARARASAAANSTPLPCKRTSPTTPTTAHNLTPQPPTKRHKSPRSPLVQKPLFNYMHPISPLHAHLQPHAHHTPVSILTAHNSLATPVPTTTPAKSDRAHVQSIASLLSPSSDSPRIPKLVLPGPTPDAAERPASSDLPSFHGGTSSLRCVGSKRSPSTSFVLPPISSLKVLSNPTPFR
ncbi:hypothetical protein BWQ96_06498 [Gracilariopsis chorda]|uniref:Helicase-associated domain-containing protein n=1 Tax=Gracilariopsis chorda TaxID=448386 RepID=A0A2V3INV3_9FLOR|nr:hypothetical protein BWQ96_06498 [Gracilariopsis chorda]|eukprot:PXF43766.1 hypothetical protein BWQ96_06498 [Gracilariopsis chorda]